MEWTTHVVTGVGLGYAITGDWKLSLISGAMAVIPDLDEPRSKFGKIFFFISIPLSMIFEHRTFTHSLLFVVLLSGIISLFSWNIALATGIGVLTHILGDIVTGKVKLLYPHSKSIGINVSRITYLLIDRLTKVLTAVLLGVVIYKEILLYL